MKKEAEIWVTQKHRGRRKIGSKKEELEKEIKENN